MKTSPDVARDDRVVMFLPTLRGGGAERNMLRLAGDLAESGRDVTIIVADARGPLKHLVPKSAEFIDLGVKFLPLSVVRLARWLRNNDVAVVISVINGANVVALAAREFARSRVPIVVTERNTLSSWRLDSWKPDRRWIIPWLVRRLYRRADAIVAVSESVANDLASYARLPAERVQVVPNPVVGNEIVAAAGEPLPQHVVAWLGTSSLVLSVGRLVAQKDPFSLLDAFQLVLREMPEAKLAIVGDGPMKTALQRRIVALGIQDSVCLVGFLSNPYPIIARANVLALTSRYEGLPTVLIEAMALGTAVVATDAPGGAREILGDGRWGRLVPVGDARGIADAVVAALAEMRTPQREEALTERPDGQLAGTHEDVAASPLPIPDEALERYRQESVVARYLSIIESVDVR